jgi:hypothetical protein
LLLLLSRLFNSQCPWLQIAVVPSRDSVKHAELNRRLKHINERMDGTGCKGVRASPADAGHHVEAFVHSRLVQLNRTAQAGGVAPCSGCTGVLHLRKRAHDQARGKGVRGK